ncbi:MAG: hypothetical protein U5K27_06345 [Desulfotignum sp.]|nr:hypothetical protein [Desulfotignum sp.]
MSKRPAYRKGYNKKELMHIIDKIDAGKSQMKNQTENVNTNTVNNSTFFSCDMVKPDKYSE